MLKQLIRKIPHVHRLVRSRDDVAHTVDSVAKRLQDYRRFGVSSVIYEHDSMFRPGAQGAARHYFSVGESAIRIIAQMMIAADRISFGTVLDLPCGAGRVTRHLQAFFPDARLFAAELEEGARDFTCRTFNATRFDAPVDFCGNPSRAFDLIFVGSLVTHFNAEMTERAIRWFVSALADDGILIVTTHGRRHDHLEREHMRLLDPAVWARVSDEVAQMGFGYAETERKAGASYGFSWSAPSWLMRLIETDARITILGYQESVWDDHQDVFALIKTPMARPHAPWNEMKVSS